MSTSIFTYAKGGGHVTAGVCLSFSKVMEGFL